MSTQAPIADTLDPKRDILTMPLASARSLLL
jgi:hypothetical protein